jgi:hypothetical protein
LTITRELEINDTKLHNNCRHVIFWIITTSTDDHVENHQWELSSLTRYFFSCTSWNTRSVYLLLNLVSLLVGLVVPKIHVLVCCVSHHHQHRCFNAQTPKPVKLEAMRRRRDAWCVNTERFFWIGNCIVRESKTCWKTRLISTWLIEMFCVYSKTRKKCRLRQPRDDAAEKKAMCGSNQNNKIW